MAIGDTVTAARFNLLQNRIAAILGFGSGLNGYGQGLPGYGPSLSSAEVSSLSESNRNTITAETINDLYIDLLRARIHQIGLNNSEITDTVKNLRIVQDRNVVAEQTSFFVDDQGLETVDVDGALKGIADFEDLMSRIEIDKFLIHTSQGVEESGESHFRVTPWNSVLDYEVKVTFRSLDHRRHFFNSGGEIRIQSELENPAGSKADDWANLLNLAGIVKFAYNGTTTTDQGVTYPIGNNNLGSTYQTIFTKSSAGLILGGVYVSNVYSIQVKKLNDREIQFKIQFNDAAGDNAIDDVVQGTLRSNISHFRAKGSFSVVSDNFLNVEVPAPTYVNMLTF